MGPANQAMWKAYGIHASRHSKISNYCTHPMDETRRLYFYADVPHAFKNAKARFVNHNIVTIPDQFVKRYSLSSNIAKCKHLDDVINEDKSIDLKLAPQLREEYLDSSNHFQKMRVKSARVVFNEQVSAALQYLSSNNSNDERLTTGWFIDFMSRWFYAMCSRNVTKALSYKVPETFRNAVTCLEEAIELFTDMKVGIDGRWKPFQTACIISTQTVLELSNYLLSNGFTFFLPSRLTQDCIENLFSIVRMKNVIPNALQFKNNLKLITISQYMKTICKSNYDADDRQFLSDFLNILLQNRSINSHVLTDSTYHFEPQISNQRISINKTELNILYYIAGYIIVSIRKNQTACNMCINATRSNAPIRHKYNVLTRIKAEKNKTYFFVNTETFQFFIQMERIFRTYYKHVRLHKINLKHFFCTKYEEIAFSLPECHNLKKKIILRYHAFRLKNCSTTLKLSKHAAHASKSVAMHEYIK